ncbi:RagB/SusD family nutrient uptake outer membrane protein [Pedobacter sp. ISL-68]|uniref:RagB/SusD family nutrient uptake outer membrane protein n=1 Tax=unclassified Pedobacter TaxID=2628915 RepID=UPI001BE82C30|nr:MULTISPECIES: RagB/SusD family nutrient uptake outer membrane protein [unclassified Pedobacter]MBT2563329.1 RagB/SusD family nutrient uptake outer membrane protein [Pedobacter sp. ISL-64]MBT2588630.1 RagB/SusD family nutrient uptake outer membrane protein [Pedobacter sp. ISL-68]
MKKIYIIIAFLILILGNGCKKDFLEREPLDSFSDDTYWRTEKEVSTFAWGFYTGYFTGYGSGFTFGKYFSGETLNDDFAPTTPTAFTKNVPTSGGGWSFTFVRKANIFIDRVSNSTYLSDDIKKNWVGVGRFFRALEYNDLVKAFGDFPYYDKPLEETSIDLYKPRDPQIVVLDNMLADFKYAAENVRATDALVGPNGQIVNKSVVLAFMSRVFLYHGTLLKYSNINPAKATEYLEAAKWAANEVMTKGGYSLGAKYRTLFSSLDLKGNPEIILYRQYGTAQSTHSLVSYVNREPQTGPSKNAIDAYLCTDGLPASVSPLYQGDKSIANVMANRDPRMKETFVSDLRLPGIASNYSTSGYSVLKFLMEDQTLWGTAEALSSTNTTDAPIIRLGEVMMNFAEASAELGTLTQADLDNSINKLRKRGGISMPNLQVIGGQPAINGVVYNDPQRDLTVSSLIWEIRRERRIELMMEGFRNDDLKRWRKYAYIDTKLNTSINRGAWIKKADYPKATVTIDGTTEGYIIPAPKPETQRTFDNDKVYLSPLPLDQIKLYKDQGIDLKQNPGWQ